MIKNKLMHINRITQSVIVGSLTLIAAISWSGLKGILFGNGNWILPIAGFLILLIVLSLSWLLAKSKAVLSVTLFFILVSFLFVFGFRLIYLPILIIALLFFVLGSFRAINEKEIRIKIQVTRIIYRGMSYVLTGLCFAAAAAYYFSPLALVGQNHIELPRPLFDITAKPIIGIIEEQMPLSELSQFSEKFGISLGEDLKIAEGQMEDILYQEINQEINKYALPYKEYFPLGLALGFFLALRAIAVPFSWLVILISWLIFRVLVSLGAIKIQEQAVLKEVIEI